MYVILTIVLLTSFIINLLNITVKGKEAWLPRAITAGILLITALTGLALSESLPKTIDREILRNHAVITAKQLPDAEFNQNMVIVEFSTNMILPLTDSIVYNKVNVGDKVVVKYCREIRNKQDTTYKFISLSSGLDIIKQFTTSYYANSEKQ